MAGTSHAILNVKVSLEGATRPAMTACRTAGLRAVRRGNGVPDRLSGSGRQNQPRLCVGHTEDVLKFQEMRQLGCFLRAQPRLSFALDEFSHALLSFLSIRP